MNDEELANMALRAFQKGASETFIREELACATCYQCRTPLLAYRTFWRSPNRALPIEHGPVAVCNSCLGITGHAGRLRHE